VSECSGHFFKISTRKAARFAAARCRDRLVAATSQSIITALTVAAEAGLPSKIRGSIALGVSEWDAIVRLA
jgi:hypothetical protein